MQGAQGAHQVMGAAGQNEEVWGCELDEGEGHCCDKGNKILSH